MRGHGQGPVLEAISVGRTIKAMILEMNQAGFPVQVQQGPQTCDLAVLYPSYAGAGGIRPPLQG
eukprot:513921-Rhodomonas_salina.1